jgi:predicted transcriptional regulator
VPGSCSRPARRYQSDTMAYMAFTVRSDEELEEALTTLTAAEGISRQELIRRAVLDRLARAGHATRVRASSDKMTERWQELLDRLGSV